MKRLIQRIRQKMCRHEWQPSKYQALIPGADYFCTKCGKYQTRYPR